MIQYWRVRRIKADININVCTSIGLLSEGQAEQLAAAGVTRGSITNLESSRDHFPEVCSTHSYDDRIRTVRAAEGGRHGSVLRRHHGNG